MPTVTYDERSLLVDGKPTWLSSGEVHYFRIPAACWPDRLLKARRGGLNCVSTPIAWNFHEPVEGKWDFTGDRDIVEFVRLAAELGLYVILRPGPYIGADVDFGGIPAWLSTKGGVNYRTSNAAFTHYSDKYLGQVLPRLADLQVTRGGNIILIQNEHRYWMTTMPDRRNYLEFINQLFRRSGFEIPILSCNDFTDPPAPNTIECAAAGDDAVSRLNHLRRRQPNRPLILSQFRPTAADTWGHKHASREPAAVARLMLEAVGCGAQVNYYTYCGGTNFDFRAGRLADGDDAFCVTSYDLDSPVAEGGGLTEKFYTTRLVNLTATHMGKFLAGSVMPEAGARITDGTDVINTAGHAGAWAVVTNNGSRHTDQAGLALPDGTKLTVPLAPLGAAAVPMDLLLNEQAELDYCNLTPLGLFADKYLLLHGPGGFEAQVSINTKVISAKVPSGEEPKLIEHEGVIIVLLSSDLAMRTWPMEDSIIFGPEFVGETADDLTWGKAKQVTTLSLTEGKLSRKKSKPAAGRKSQPPRLGKWTRILVCNEPLDEELDWRKLDKPRDADRLGLHYGYVWYRAEIEQPRAKKRKLLLPDCEDRAIMFHNGELAGVWGRGEGATRSPIDVSFNRGVNVLALLVDNMGRFADGPLLGERKGLFGPVWDARAMRTGKFRIKQQDGFSKRIIPRALSSYLDELLKLPVFSAELDISLKSVRPVHLSLRDVPHHFALLCNDRTVGFFPSTGKNFADVTLGSELKKGKNRLTVMLWGDVTESALKGIELHELQEDITAGTKWSYRPWTVPAEPGRVVGKNMPAWYRATFKCSEPDRPLFLHILGAKKGQILLNGHNVGRFWTIGPQEDYYLPGCLMREQNELLLFEEYGNIPTGSRLVYRDHGPFRD
ncbi:MAG: beta-galactosidase [Phycisphaerae bacterium]